MIAVAHVKKSDRRLKELVPPIEDFHGTSDVPKIATKAIMIAPARDVNTGEAHRWATYISPLKCRFEGARTRFTARVVFDARLNLYEPGFQLGRLTEGDTKFENVDSSNLPGWAREKPATIERNRDPGEEG